MKKILLQLFFCALLLNSCSPKKGPVIQYESKIINLGDIKFKESYNGKILVKNIGDKILQIDEITADCSCTVPTIKNKRISPGDSINITFVLTPADNGFIQQSIFVNNNSINESRVLFLIRAKVNLSN